MGAPAGACVAGRGARGGGAEDAELVQGEHGDQLEEGGDGVAAGEQERERGDRHDGVAAVLAELARAEDPGSVEPEHGNRDLEEEAGGEHREQDELVVAARLYEGVKRARVEVQQEADGSR